MGDKYCKVGKKLCKIGQKEVYDRVDNEVLGLENLFITLKGCIKFYGLLTST